MQIYNLKTDAEKLQNMISNTKTAVALGQFDAIHIGHTEIIADVVKYAKENGLKSLVYMFENNPQEVVSGTIVPSVNTMEKRLEILESLGVDITVLEIFDKEYMRISYKDFVCNHLSEKFNAALVSVGYNYRFGENGIGDAELLVKECNKFNIDVSVVPKVELCGEAVSSTAVRQKISDGDIEGAGKMLGRCFSIKGKVVKGNQIGGKLLGFPTANIELPQGIVLPKFGVYASQTRLGGRVYKSITNIGSKPTVEENKMCIETHIDGDFNELYGQVIEVEFCRYIRDIKKFESLDDLVAQLRKDKESM